MTINEIVASCAYGKVNFYWRNVVFDKSYI